MSHACHVWNAPARNDASRFVDLALTYSASGNLVAHPSSSHHHVRRPHQPQARRSVTGMHTSLIPRNCHADRHARPIEGARAVPRNRTGARPSSNPNPHPHQPLLGQVSLPTVTSRSVWIPIISVFALSRCVGSISSGFSGKEQSCLENCVGRFFDASDYLIRRVEQQRAMAGAQ